MYLLKVYFFSLTLQYYGEMLESGIYVRDFGTRLEEINLENSGSTLKGFVVENEKAS